MQQRLDFNHDLPDIQGPLADLFHPAVACWFQRAYAEPTPVQQQAWQRLRRGQHVLISAPTGAGKTLAAFLAAINDLVEEGLQRSLADEVRVLYVSPLRALSNDIRHNLQQPLAGIRRELLACGLHDVPIRDGLRTGDTSTAERAAMRRRPPQILVTTPESLFILLSSDSGRRMLASTRSVIVDELHALAGSKRGAHLALSLERLDALCTRPPQRVGLSATQKPLETMARMLCGVGRDCEIVEAPPRRRPDLAIELPRSPLTAVMAAEVWDEVYERLAEYAREHRTTLVFVNQRRMAERLARQLAERLGEDAVTAHHGSLSKEHRLRAEQRLKAGELRALVATASLELGIDIGDVDLVIQVGSPRSINALVQRIGRSGHAVDGVSKGRLFPLSGDDLVECAALLRAIEDGELDRSELPRAPRDVLAQQIVAEAACSDWSVDALHGLLCRAAPYAGLTRAQFEAVVQMLAEGYATRRGRRGALLHHDAVNQRLRGRRGARLVAVTNGGAIPDLFEVDVLLSPEDLRVGSVNEDFAFDSSPGDIFQLGNRSYRILKVETGRVFVEDAAGQPPTMPFWFGEAPGRSDELSRAVSRLRDGVAERLAAAGDTPTAAASVQAWLGREYGLGPDAAGALGAYLGAAWRALGTLPTRERIVFERFFDEVGDSHFVVHAPYGARINRAWGLALRKKFCRQFNFELQAAALDDSLVLSLGPTHSFPLEEVSRYLRAAGVAETLEQAVLQAPMFPTRWRWVASTALAVQRQRGGRRVPPQFQRSDAEDLLTHAFPDAVACQDNLPGHRAVPDHPLVRQALDDCLHEVMDLDGFRALLVSIERAEVEVVCRDLTAPSPLAEAIVSARPYAFLDDGDAEERRTRAVRTMTRPGLSDAGGPGRLDPELVEQVRRQMHPQPASADELHDALLICGFLTEEELRDYPGWLDELRMQRRVACLQPVSAGPVWLATERLPLGLAVWPDARQLVEAPLLSSPGDPALALVELLRGRLELDGPVTAAGLGELLVRPPAEIEQALLTLETQGSVMRGRFDASGAEQWCERSRLARIHRLHRDRRRARTQCVPAAAMMRFLLRWHGIGEDPPRSGAPALDAVLEQLEGLPVAALAWESEVLPARLEHYCSTWMDQLGATGRYLWRRAPHRAESAARGGPVRSTPIVILRREHAAYWRVSPAGGAPTAPARRLLQVLEEYGPAFYGELLARSGLLSAQVEQGLGELVGVGLVSADGFAGLRALIAPAKNKARARRIVGLRAGLRGLEAAGRWYRLQQAEPPADPWADVEARARVLLRRYGILFRRLIEREVAAPPWRELSYALRRLEAREEIVGGRFVAGFSGEQFALPEALPLLEACRDGGDGRLQALAGCDPLNLSGQLLPGERVPALPGHRLLLRDGVPVARYGAGELHCLVDVDSITRSAWRARLLTGSEQLVESRQQAVDLFA
jgi:ATP-dependent Lhr-like helicase